MNSTHIQKLQKILYTDVSIKKLFKIKTDDTIESMERIDFIDQNEFHIKSRRLLGEPTTPTMIRILLRIGLAKDEKQALIILITLTIGVFLATLFLINSRFNNPTDNLVTDSQGNSYTFDEYMDLVRQGKDPLLPK